MAPMAFFQADTLNMGNGATKVKTQKLAKRPSPPNHDGLPGSQRDDPAHACSWGWMPTKAQEGSWSGDQLALSILPPHWAPHRAT